MKQLSIIFLFCIAILGCKKEDANPTNNNNNNNNTDSVSVTGWLPEKPFWGEIIEVTGTGFPTDTSDIKIYFTGSSGPSDFEESRGTIISITPTKITAKIPYERFDDIYCDCYVPMNRGGYGKIIIDVKDKPRYIISNYIYYKARPFIIGIDNRTGIINGPLYLGKKIELYGFGFGTTKDNFDLFANGVKCPIDSVWENDNVSWQNFGIGSKRLIATLPTSIGVKADYDSTMMVEFKVVRDGFVATKEHSTYKCPKLKYVSSNLSTVMNTPSKEIIINGENLFANELEFRDINNPSYTTNVQVTGAAMDATEVRSIVPLAQFNLRPPGNYYYNVYLVNKPEPLLYIHMGYIFIRVL
jgi:hypothetical protein